MPSMTVTFSKRSTDSVAADSVIRLPQPVHTGERETAHTPWRFTRRTGVLIALGGRRSDIGGRPPHQRFCVLALKNAWVAARFPTVRPSCAEIPSRSWTLAGLGSVSRPARTGLSV